MKRLPGADVVDRQGRLRWPAALFFPALYLFVLPYAHVTALRSIGFAGTVAILVYVLVKRAHHPLPLKAPLVFWLAAALASIPTSVDLAFTLRDIRSDVIYGIATFYAFFLLTYDVRTFRRWRRVAIASMALVGLIAIVAFARRGSWGNGYQNFLGEYSTGIITALPLLASTFFPGALQGSRVERACVGAAIALGLGGGLLGRSRAFWVVVGTTAVAASVLYALKDWRRRRVVLLAGVAVFVFAIVAGVVVSRERNLALDTIGIRKPLYTFVIKNISQHPFYGTGFGRETNREVYRKRFPHSGILLAADALLSYTAQMGVWGAIALIWLFGALAVPFWRAWRSSKPEFAAAGAAGLMLLLAVGLKNTTDMFFAGQELLLFWAHAGILLGFLSAQQRAPSTAVAPATDA